MAQRYYFIIPGEPVAMGRHRTTKTGHTYTPQKTRDAKAHIAHSVSRQFKSPPLGSPLRLTVIFYFPPSKEIQKKQPDGVRRGDIPVAKKPDLDNLIKTVGDALNGILWEDDKLIVDVRAVKQYSLEPRIGLMVEVLQ